MILSIIATVLLGVFVFLASLTCCHMFQLEGYKTSGYGRWLSHTGLSKYWAVLILAALYLGATYAALAVQGMLGVIVSIVCMAGFAALGLYYLSAMRVKNAKKPLVYTARVKRMLITEGIVIAALCAAGYAAGVMLTAVILLFTHFWIAAANWINKPIEKAVCSHYLNDAKRKLAARDDLIKIAITGSYGKTSTKFILGAILGAKFDVLVPPSSYNTPMGLTRVIREQMTDGNQVMIAEMGAKHIGDIAELVELIRPQYGLITSVGPQHLETFKNIKNVAKTKYELIEGLPEDGVAFFPDDGGITKRMYDNTEMEKRLFSVDQGGDVWAEEIAVGNFGSRFTACFKSGERIPVETKLLGRHNIQNVLGGIAVAKELGMTPEEIAEGTKRIEPVEHRLQIIPTTNGITVIDDAFNANPAGTRVAMEVLRQFGGRKIVVTPGMVELGSEEEAENRKFGENMAKAADIVYLIGRKHTRPIYEGLVNAGFDEGAIVVMDSLDGATRAMGPILRAGDVLLYENDLPDNYNE